MIWNLVKSRDAKIFSWKTSWTTTKKLWDFEIRINRLWAFHERIGVWGHIMMLENDQITSGLGTRFQKSGEWIYEIPRIWMSVRIKCSQKWEIGSEFRKRKDANYLLFRIFSTRILQDFIYSPLLKI